MNKLLYILLLLATLGPSPIRGELERGSFPPILGEADGGSTAVDTLLELTPAQADSLEFRLLHHYTNNFNFVVKADSLVLIPREDELYDTCKVRKDDRIAVADIRESDTIWIKVARDQFTMGWIPEDELLQGVVPDDSISQVIDSLTVSRYIWMSVLVVLGILGFVAFVLKRRGLPQLQIFRFDEMDSFYPTLFLILVASLACLYASIQKFTPEFWQEYYFHPTLNPLILPTVMAVLVTLMWIVIIAFIAMLIDVYHHFDFFQGLTYVLEMLGLAMVSYLIISWTTSIYIGYLLLALYIILLLWIYSKYIRCPYTCGFCGRSIRTKGTCPHCRTPNS